MRKYFTNSENRPTEETDEDVELAALETERDRFISRNCTY